MDEALIQEQERQLQKTGRYYKHVFWLCVPLLCMACYFYGARPLLLCGDTLSGNLHTKLSILLPKSGHFKGNVLPFPHTFYHGSVFGDAWLFF